MESTEQAFYYRIEIPKVERPSSRNPFSFSPPQPLVQVCKLWDLWNWNNSIIIERLLNVYSVKIIICFWWSSHKTRKHIVMIEHLTPLYLSSAIWRLSVLVRAKIVWNILL